MNTNPIEYHVQEILNNLNYLTEGQAKRLLAVFPEEVKKDSNKDGKKSLKAQIERHMRLMERLENAVSTSTDVGEMKQVLAASKDLFTLLSKFREEIKAEERLSAVEQSILETFKELEDKELTNKFLSIWKGKIAALEQRVAE